MKIRPVGALFHAVGQTDRRTDRHDDASAPENINDRVGRGPAECMEYGKSVRTHCDQGSLSPQFNTHVTKLDEWPCLSVELCCRLYLPVSVVVLRTNQRFRLARQQSSCWYLRAGTDCSEVV